MADSKIESGLKNVQQSPEPQTGQDKSDIGNLCSDTFQKMADYLHGEITATTEDYKLLENMNRATISKYEEMKQISNSINRSIKDLDARYETLQPFLEQIDQVEESVASLEQAAYKLDAYSKRLETKFKQLEKR